MTRIRSFVFLIISFSSMLKDSSRKREFILDGDKENFIPFLNLREKELFEVDRNILARAVYKNHYQFRRIDILDRIKNLVKVIDSFLSSADITHIPKLLKATELAAERFFQQLSMGLMIPMSITIVAAIGRIAEIARRVPQVMNVTNDDDDYGVPVDR